MLDRWATACMRAAVVFTVFVSSSAGADEIVRHFKPSTTIGGTPDFVHWETSNLPADMRITEIHIKCHDNVGRGSDAAVMVEIDGYEVGRHSVFRDGLHWLAFKVHGRAAHGKRLRILGLHEDARSRDPKERGGENLLLEEVIVWGEPKGPRESDPRNPTLEDQRALESHVLQRFAPTWVLAKESARPPLSIGFVLREASLRRVLELDETTGQHEGHPNIAEIWPAGMWTMNSIHSDGQYQLRLGSDVADGRSNRGLSEMTHGRSDQWVYGRVTPLGDDRYQVLYAIFFGWNNTTAPEGGNLLEVLGIPPGVGNHEGDWICVDFDVTFRIADPSNAKIDRAIFHNHGRQIFATGSMLQYGDDGRPLVFLENEAQEAWPVASHKGLMQENQAIPTGMYSNKRLDGVKKMGILFGDEGDSEYPAVRDHSGQGKRLPSGFVVNVGQAFSEDLPTDAQFFHLFDGRWGSNWVSGPGFETVSPKSPRHNSKKWSRNFKDTRAWVKE